MNHSDDEAAANGASSKAKQRPPGPGRRQVLSAAMVSMLVSVPAWAAEWPERPIRLVIGYPPGGSADGVARPLLAPMAKALGQPMVMDYKPGAGGATAAESVSRAPAEGYTLHLIEGSVLTALPHLRKLNFDPVRSLKPVGMVAVGGVAIVAHPSLGISNVNELIQLAMSQPGAIQYGTSGMGGAQHLAAELFQAAAGIKMQHVPYRGGAPAMSDLIGGQIKLLFSSMGPAVPAIKAGTIKALGVTSRERSSSLPDVPTVAEQGLKGYEAEVWLGVVAPVGLPAAVEHKLGAVLSNAMANKETHALLRAQGYEPSQDSGADLARRVRRDSAKWAEVIKTAGISLE